MKYHVYRKMPMVHAREEDGIQCPNGLRSDVPRKHREEEIENDGCLRSKRRCEILTSEVRK